VVASEYGQNAALHHGDVRLLSSRQCPWNLVLGLLLDRCLRVAIKRVMDLLCDGVGKIVARLNPLRPAVVVADKAMGALQDQIASVSVMAVPSNGQGGH